MARTRTRYVTLTVERIKKEDADKLARHIVTEMGAVTLFVQPWRAEKPDEDAQ